MRRRFTVPCLLTATVVAAMLMVPAPAAARELGEMTDYDLAVPVDGSHHLWDTFWASRSHGIHHAQDLMAAKGTPVVAAASGTVRLVNWTAQAHMNADRCCSIVVRHDDGWESVYIHLDNDTPGTDDGRGWGIADGIAPGVPVRAGQVIGFVGDSGNAEATASHLHFELLDPSGTYVNPYHALVAAGATTNAPEPADPLFSGSRLLRVGDRGADVARLQEVLTDLGHRPGPNDGIFGSRTDAAVRAFQEGTGLHVDGLVGSATRGALQWEVAPPDHILRHGSRGHDVNLLQDRLNEIGYSVGTADGIFGPKTLLGVTAFQEDAGLTVDGLVGPQTRAALGM